MLERVAVGTLVVVLVALGAGPAAGQSEEEGRSLYDQHCSACHQPGGTGVPGAFPPLAGNPTVMDAEYVRDVIRNGLSGPITVLGETYDAVMPPVTALDAGQIDSVIAYLQSLGGDGGGGATTTTLLGGVLPQPLAARQGRPQHARRELHRRLHLEIHVKDGIVTWEMQGLDYPLLEAGLPPYEPRGCQRGISFSWYLYSPSAREVPVHPRRAARPLEEGPRASTTIRSRPGSRSWRTIPRARWQRRAARAVSAASTGTRCWRSSPRRTSTRSRSTGRTASRLLADSRRCR
jgi:mono/diheme cytochrome c family protein